MPSEALWEVFRRKSRGKCAEICNFINSNPFYYATTSFYNRLRFSKSNLDVVNMFPWLLRDIFWVKHFTESSHFGSCSSTFPSNTSQMGLWDPFFACFLRFYFERLGVWPNLFRSVKSILVLSFWTPNMLGKNLLVALKSQKSSFKKWGTPPTHTSLTQKFSRKNEKFVFCVF